MNAVFLDFSTMGSGLDVSELHALLPGLEVFDVTSERQIAERIAGKEFVLTNKSRLNEGLIANNPELRFIGLTATGTDNVDLVAARQHNVAVSNIRDYCTQSVAEHVFAALLNLTRSLKPITASVRAGDWQRSDDFCLLQHPIGELSAKTFGIVGLGVLGTAVAKIAASFGMQVIISQRPGSETMADDRVPFVDMLQQADVISLHCPLNDTTKNLFSSDEFRQMKSTAILVNTSRGGLIDSAALANALRDGEIAAAAVDVLPEEPPVNGDPLLDYEGSNLLLTPHIAWASDVARQAAIDQLAKNVAAFLSDEERNRVA